MSDLRKQRDELMKALNGFIWLGNNLDNMHKPFFREAFEACLADAKTAKALSDWDGSGFASPEPNETATVTDDELIRLARAITYAQEMGIEDDLREALVELRQALSRDAADKLGRALG